MSGGPLTSVRVALPTAPGEEARVETVAREGLAREVLVGRALPLLRRARRLLDDFADPTHPAALDTEHRNTCERLADAIAALIGHPVTDAPPADELEAVLREGEPARLTWEQIDTLPRDLVLPRSALPLEPAVPAETPAEKTHRHERINEALERLGIEVVPACPMAPYAESSEPAARTPYGGRPVACDGCGARPDDGVQCLAPSGRHTWRPLDGPSNDELLAARAVPQCTSHGPCPLHGQHHLDLRGPAGPDISDYCANEYHPGCGDCDCDCHGRESSEPATPVGTPPPGPAAPHQHRWIGTHDRGPVCAICGIPKPQSSDAPAAPEHRRLLGPGDDAWRIGGRR